MKIDIPSELLETNSSSTVVNSLVKSLKNPINLNKNAEISSVSTLCVYWLVLDEADKAKRLLECIYGHVEYKSNNMPVWIEYGYSLPLLAELCGEGEKALEIVSALNSEDIIGDSRQEYFSDFVEEGYPEALSEAELESRKYQCEIYADQIRELLYHKHMLRYEDEAFAESVMDTISPMHGSSRY